jgi:hypothetical protein
MHCCVPVLTSAYAATYFRLLGANLGTGVCLVNVHLHNCSAFPVPYRQPHSATRCFRWQPSGASSTGQRRPNLSVRAADATFGGSGEGTLLIPRRWLGRGLAASFRLVTYWHLGLFLGISIGKIEASQFCSQILVLWLAIGPPQLSLLPV